MADDIDIEEHDILENPRVKDILPHIDSIKSEPLDLEDPTEEYEDFNNYDSYQDSYQEDMEEDMDFEYTEAREMVQYEHAAEDTEVFPFNNKIILGSKPCPDPEDCDLDVVVVLEDWGERLKNSNCFCKECKILFATRNALDAHNMTAHSFLVAVEAPQIEEPPEIRLNVPDNPRFCNHCQVLFNDDNLLIQHLYELITAKNAKKTENNDSLVHNASMSVKSIIVYTCPICFFRYKERSSMETHILNNHASNAKELKRAPFDPICRICNLAYSNLQSYNRHIKLQHSTYFVKKINMALKAKSNIKEQLLGQAKNMKPPKFRCGICKCTFLNSKSAKLHHSNSHPGTENKIVMVVPKTVATKIKKPLTNPKMRVGNNGLLPSKVLFKCSKCQVHLMYCITALAHLANCREGSVGKNFKCQHCHKVFRDIDKKLHELQHRHTDKFKVFVTHTNIYSRVLYRCPKCEVCFEERLFLRHIKVSCKNAKNVEYCSGCKLNINNMPLHNQKHVDKKFIKSDFILIDEFVSTTAKSYGVVKKQVDLKRKYPDELEKPMPVKIRKLLKFDDNKFVNTANLPKNKPQEEKKYTFYYCKACQTYVKMKKRQKFHLAKMCKNFKKKQHCPVCGLLFCAGNSLRNHMTWHTELNAELKDFVFGSITNFKHIIPPMPEFPYCKKCGVRYLSNDKRFHGCNSERNTCGQCNEILNDLGYKIHMLHHKYVKRDLLEEDLTTELIQKYQSLKPIWNILFKCETCDVTTDSYDSVVEHCQKHYNNMESYGVTICNCDVCVLQLEEPCYKRHVELHLVRPINRESFKVLSYNYLNFLTNDWLNLFDCLPKDEVHQILSRSIYYVVRSVKMTLSVDGPPEYTLYICKTCEKFVIPSNIRLHSKCCHSLSIKTPACNCAFCNLPFSSMECRNDHEKVHKTFKINADSFRIVSFNEPFDTEYNMKLELENRIIEIPTPQVLNASDAEVATKTGRKYKYYECQKCRTCTPVAGSLRTHVCLDEKHARVCPKCKHVFTYRSIYRHMIGHENREDLTRENIVLIPFNEKKVIKVYRNKKLLKNDNVVASEQKTVPSDNTHLIAEQQVSGDEKVVTIYKCSCDLHFTSPKTFRKHFASCSPDNKLSSENCSRCGLLFPTELLVSHLCNHHAGSNNKIEVKTIPTSTLFRCGSCKCLFMNRKPLRSHQRRCQPNMPNGVECETCGLYLHKTAMGAHRFQHNKFSTGLENTPCRIVTLNVINSESPAPCDEIHFEPENIEDPKNEVYKCEKCELHFVPYTAWLYHISTNHATHSSVTCSGCGLIFASSSIKRHMFLHHVKSKIKAKAFSIVKLDNPVPKNSEESSLSTVGSKCENVVYKCGTCNLHFMNIWSLHSHYLRRHIISTSTLNCEVCGLRFTTQSLTKHNALHHLKNKYTTADLCIVPIDASSFPLKYQADVPKPNVLYKCDVCAIHFVLKTALKKHVTQKDHNCRSAMKCDRCDLTFSKSNLEKHLELHHTRVDLKQDEFQIVNYADLDKEDYLLDAEESSDTLYYKSDNSPTKWDQKINLYKCKSCDIHFCNQTSLSRHIELNHKTRSKICEKCNLKFALSSLQQHDSEHHEMFNCTSESFIITEIGDKVTDDMSEENTGISNFKAPTMDSPNLNSQPPKKHTKQKIDTIYKCSTCDIHYLNLKSLQYHFDNNHRTIRDCLNCPTCDLRFSCYSLKNHKILHHSTSKTNDLYIASIDAVTNKTCKATLVPRIKDFTKSNVVNESTSESNSDNCAETNSEIGAEPNNKICSETNTEICTETNIEISAETNTEISSESNSEIVTVTPQAEKVITKLFKCGICGCHFSKTELLTKHLRYGSHEKDCLMDCTECGLLFSTKYMPRHMVLHHHSDAVTKEDFEIIEKGSLNASSVSENLNESVISSMDVDTSLKEPLMPTKKHRFKLYKCTPCNVYFLNQNLCYKHCKKHIPLDAKEYIACKLCGFQFRIAALGLHMKCHHKNKFDLDEVLVEEYLPESLGKVPKIDIYCAIDKVQSGLVSTTTDDKDMNQTVKEAALSVENVVSVEPKSINNAIDNAIDNSSDDITPVVIDECDKNNAEADSVDKKITEKLPNQSDYKTENSKAIGENTMVVIPSSPKIDMKEELNDSLKTELELTNSFETQPEMMDVAEPDPEKCDTNDVIEIRDDDNVGDKIEYSCRYCSEKFKNNTSREFHESLDHLDAMKECQICQKSFNTSILNELHLRIKNDQFICCLCNTMKPVDSLLDHSSYHKSCS